MLLYSEEVLNMLLNSEEILNMLLYSEEAILQQRGSSQHVVLQ